MEKPEVEVAICTSMIESLSQLMTKDYNTKQSIVDKTSIIKDYKARLNKAEKQLKRKDTE
jgi:hypothetical protein